MKSGRIFLLSRENTLTEMRESPYDSEYLLQRFLADHPLLLPGDQIDSENPRRWLLVQREFGVADGEDASLRWSLDHLFLDQDGVPTLVEVKRSSDARARREVVAQMLDYAANILAYAPVERVRIAFENRCQKERRDPAAEIAEALDRNDIEPFWQQVKTNLEAGRVRLLFVADEIAPELRRIVEYLNSQMRSAEVLAVEIKQYVGGDQRTLVPTVIGQTAEAEQAKSAGREKGVPWDEERFFGQLTQSYPAGLPVARAVYNWAVSRAEEFPGSDIFWGSGATMGSFYPRIRYQGRKYVFPGVWAQGHLEATFQYIRSTPPFDDDVLRRELFDHLNAIGAQMPVAKADLRPSFRLDAVQPDALIRVLDWYAGQILASPDQPQ